MKAVFLPGNKRVEIRAVEVPKPRQDEVLVQVKASCICRSDLSLYYGNAVVGGDAAGRCITGHEPAGIIVEVGSAVRQFKKDDRVAIHLAVGCGVCAYCRAGHFHLCAEWTCLGFTADGGNAEYIAVPERNLLRLPDSMSYVAGAISTDAFGTLCSAARKLGINGLSTVGVWGLGPMGSAGVLAAKALGGKVIALDPIAERREFAASLGADLVLDPTSATAHEEIMDFSGGGGITACLDCSGNGVAQNMALDVAAPFAKVAFVGESRETMIKPSDQLIRKQVTLMGSWYFGVAEYEDILRIIETGKIDLEKLATHTFSLDEAETAFRLFDERKTEKAVFVM
ncbi:MAG: alcohol dehydrogenase catalytic domain-containing protein [Agrobacterium sp.]|uniref:alcohol dehydrogenase catalytic domain-containing protein n=2 Tax=Hyphomicrobiales TaxID=356 RepID=UPI0009D4CBA1|nr:zinc-binding dehydrogenase [Agrobacterium tumefaciens]CUX65447.1 putative zinc-type alcohol dehydrogenase-like protein [Agrobacterium genomosp. 5 str. CFBP 6626]